MENLIKETVRSFRRVNRMLMRIIDRTVSKTSVYRGQHQVLMCIAHNSNASQAELADKLEISPAALAVSLKKLEKGGYIRKSSDSSDDRKKRIEITEQGESIVADSRRMFQEVENQMLDGFSKEEICELAQYMERMHENLLKIHECNKEEKER